ncbi:MAG: phosphoenolpyruvate-utilizing N-terminal domain-containing protein, partial [Ignavibacteria bacterium]
MPSETIYKGIAASTGISIGKAYLYTRSIFDIDKLPIDQNETDREIEEFVRAIDLSKKELNKIRTLSYQKIGEKNSLIFDAQIEILSDEFFINTVKLRIQSEERTASYIFDNEISK